MKVMGFIALTLSVCLVTASAQPLFLAPGITAAFTVADGLVLSSAATATAAATTLATIPTSTLLVGKGLIAAKALLLKKALDDANAKNKK